MHRTRLSTIVIACFFIVPHFAFGACDLNATTANFASQIAAANPGQTVCLATGDYGSWHGIQKSSPGVTITAAAGATPRIQLAFNGASPTVQWLIIDSLRIYGIDDWTGPTNNITVQNSTITGKINIWAEGPNNACSNCPSMNNANILFNNDLFNFADGGETGTFEGRFNLLGTGGNPAGVTVKNSKFTTGCADGVHVAGGGDGEYVLDNEFYNLQQGSCGPHVDAIQFEGSDTPGPTITGNYFHDNSTGIIAYDGANDAYIANNVIQNTDQSQLGGGGWSSTTIFEHNVVTNTNIQCLQSHEGNACNAIYRNNIAPTFQDVNPCCGSGTPSYVDYMFCTTGGCPGSHSINSGSPTFVGGATPSTWAGFALTSGSIGHNAASDGKDMGINTNADPSLAPPTGLTAVVQ